jgi:hypothetical protein
MTIKINAMLRLVQSMALSRKKSEAFLLNGMARQLFNHYMLVQELPNNTAVKHWKHECLIFMYQLLEATILVSGKAYKKADYIEIVWGMYASNEDDCKRSAHILAVKEKWSAKKEKDVFFNINWLKLSLDYKEWLSKWYDYYHNPHALVKNELPKNLF